MPTWASSAKGSPSTPQRPERSRRSLYEPPSVNSATTRVVLPPRRSCVNPVPSRLAERRASAGLAPASTRSQRAEGRRRLRGAPWPRGLCQHPAGAPPDPRGATLEATTSGLRRRRRCSPSRDPAEATSGLRSACASFRHRGTRPAGVSPTPRFAHHRLGRLSIGGPEVWDLPRGQRGRLVEAPNAPRWQWGSPKAGSDFRENVLGNRAPRAYNAHCPANKRAGLRPARGAAEAPSSHQLPGGRSAGRGEPRVGDTAVWELRQLPARPCGPGRVNRHLSPSCKRTTQSVGRMCPAISPACGEATAASWG